MSATPTSNGNGNGNGWTKYIVPVGFFIALLAAINGPIISKQAELQKQLDKHESQPHHYGTAEKLAAMEVKFTEVETQFKWYREISDKNDEGQKQEIGELKKEIQSLRDKLK